MLADGDEPEPGEAARRARKVNPRLSRGEPQRVAVVANIAEGELVQGILLEEGIPSYLRRSAGFDVPDFLAAGPRDVMVPASAVEAARELLTGQTQLAEPLPEGDPTRAALRFAALFLIALLIFSAIAGGLFAIAR